MRVSMSRPGVCDDNTEENLAPRLKSQMRQSQHGEREEICQEKGIFASTQDKNPRSLLEKFKIFPYPAQRQKLLRNAYIHCRLLLLFHGIDLGDGLVRRGIVRPHIDLEIRHRNTKLL